MSEEVLHPYQIVEPEIKALLSFWKELQTHPEYLERHKKEFALDYLSIWANLQRFSKDTIDDELFSSMDNIVRMNKKDFTVTFLDSVDLQQWMTLVEREFEVFDATGDPDILRELEKNSLLLFEEYDNIELAIWAVQKLFEEDEENEDFFDEIQDEIDEIEQLLGKAFILFSETLDYFELAAPYYLHLYKSYKEQVQEMPFLLNETLAKYELLEEYVDIPELDAVDEDFLSQEWQEIFKKAEHLLFEEKQERFKIEQSELLVPVEIISQELKGEDLFIELAQSLNVASPLYAADESEEVYSHDGATLFVEKEFATQVKISIEMPEQWVGMRKKVFLASRLLFEDTIPETLYLTFPIERRPDYQQLIQSLKIED